MNITRTTVSDFHQTAGGDYIFNLDEKLIYGGAEIYSAMELKRWLYADLQGTLGLARYNDSQKSGRDIHLWSVPGFSSGLLCGANGSSRISGSESTPLKELSDIIFRTVQGRCHEGSLVEDGGCMEQRPYL